jgi:hypothetical protein
MGFPIQHVFKFNKKNNNWIQALATYNQLICIKEFNGVNMGDNVKCSALPKMIEEQFESLPDEISMKCASWTNSSAFNVLPPVEKLIPSPVKNEDPEVQKQIDRTLSYFGSVMSSRHDVFVCPPKPKFSDEAQVAALLTQISDRYTKKIRALHIQSEKAFLIQHEDQTFVLFYGYGDAEGSTLGQIHLGFDIDDGFINAVGNVPDSVNGFLNEVFILWKRTNYTGELFTEKNMELGAQRQEKISLWKVNIYEESFFPKELIELADIEEQISKVKGFAETGQEEISEIEAEAQEEFESLSEEEKTNTNVERILQANGKYERYKTWLALFSQGLERLEKCLLSFKTEPSRAVVLADTLSAAASASSSDILVSAHQLANLSFMRNVQQSAKASVEQARSPSPT